MIPDPTQAFMKHRRADPSGGFHLIQDPQEAVYGAMLGLSFGTKQLVSGNQCVILSPCATECEAIRKRQSGLLRTQPLGEIDFVGIQCHHAKAQSAKQRAVF